MAEDDIWTCAWCGRWNVLPRNFTGSPGFGYLEDGTTLCYECCAKNDRKWMREHDEIGLYLTRKDDQWVVTNWPESLVIPVKVESVGNLVGVRFTAEGKHWAGRQDRRDGDLIVCKAITPATGARLKIMQDIPDGSVLQFAG